MDQQMVMFVQKAFAAYNEGREVEVTPFAFETQIDWTNFDESKPNILLIAFPNYNDLEFVFIPVEGKPEFYLHEESEQKETVQEYNEYVCLAAIEKRFSEKERQCEKIYVDAAVSPLSALLARVQIADAAAAEKVLREKRNFLVGINDLVYEAVRSVSGPDWQFDPAPFLLFRPHALEPQGYHDEYAARFAGGHKQMSFIFNTTSKASGQPPRKEILDRSSVFDPKAELNSILEQLKK